MEAASVAASVDAPVSHSYESSDPFQNLSHLAGDTKLVII